MKLPLAGSSYDLRSRAAGVSRTVNMYPAPLESGGERENWCLRDWPGLTAGYTFTGAVRGAINVRGRLFVVAGQTLYEGFANFTTVALGTIGGSGLAGMAFNLTQLAVSDGAMLYVLDLGTMALTSAPFPGGRRIQFIDQYIVFIHRGTQQFGWTDIADATSIDALNFASAEGSPDNLVDLVVDHRELILFGTDSTEIWSVVGGDEVFARNSSAYPEMGAAAEFCAQKVGGAVVWLGQSTRGDGGVYRLDGYQERRISIDWVEQKLYALDLSGASAYSLEFDGHAFYCLNVPALDTTLCHDLKTGRWFELAELVNGAYTKHRATLHAFAFGRHLMGTDSGRMYVLDPNAHSNAGDVLCRSRVFPNSATPSRDLMHYGAFSLDCDRGYGGTVMLRYTNDGTPPHGPWRPPVSLGEIGARLPRVKWERCGSARDRVWEVRCTDNVPFNPVVADVDVANG